MLMPRISSRDYGATSFPSEAICLLKPRGSHSRINPIAHVHLTGILKAAFAEENWGEEDKKPIKSMWTGNMGFTYDSLPFVGKVPSSLTGRKVHPKSAGSEWIAAGFNGEGMVHTWRSGIAVAQMILEDSTTNSSRGWQEWLPDQLLITEERIQNSDLQSQEVGRPVINRI